MPHGLGHTWQGAIGLVWSEISMYALARVRERVSSRHKQEDHETVLCRRMRIRSASTWTRIGEAQYEEKCLGAMVEPGRIISLDTWETRRCPSSHRCAGTIPSEIAQLESLRSLNLRNNKI